MARRTALFAAALAILLVSTAPAWAGTKTDTDAAKDVRQTLTLNYSSQSCSGTTYYKINSASVKWESLAIGARITNGKLNVGAVGDVDCGSGWSWGQVANYSWANPIFKTYSYSFNWKYTSCLGACSASMTWPGGAVAANASVRAENRLGSSATICSTAILKGSTNC